MSTHQWWQTAVFYQIYPRSFADGNGDGIGDFKGATEKLDYLASLGVDAVWLSPNFPSPNWDCGYDISDYCSVAPEYGTLEDFKNFLREAHKRNIRVILDLVLNHTSNEHPWFLESKSSRTNPKADWYVWKDTPPNNWQSCFDGNAWTYIPERDQYYYHFFMKQQPDLNWHNPAVKEAMWEAVHFWLDMGVDGYRLDAIGTIYEDPGLTPHPIPMNLAQIRRAHELANTAEEKEKVSADWAKMFEYQHSQPGLHGLMKELRSILNEYDGDRMLVGEDDNIDFIGNGQDELHLVFNFPLMKVEKITPEHIHKNQRERLSKLDALPAEKGWPCNTLGNHDTPRLYSCYGNKLHGPELARLHAALVLTLKGTPFLYNGEEIGMTDLLLSDISQVKDTMGSWYYHTLVTEMNVQPDEAMSRTAAMTRDRNRTPMQWSNNPNAGFSPKDINPWLPVNPNYRDGINVQDQEKNPSSLLNYYKHLLRIRKESPALKTGEQSLLHESAVDYLAFIRQSPEQTVLVVLNFSESTHELDFSSSPEINGVKMRSIFSSAERRAGELNAKLKVSPFEVLIVEVIRE